ncbi:Hpt domain protein [compost metagenome]
MRFEKNPWALKPETVRVSVDFEGLIPLFMARRQDDLSAWEAALARADAEALEAIGHRLKGTCATFGFQALTEMGEALEAMARNEAWDEAAALLDAFREYLASVSIHVVPD